MVLSLIVLGTLYVRMIKRDSEPGITKMQAIVSMGYSFVNNTYVKMLEALGYDIELHYVKREE